VRGRTGSIQFRSWTASQTAEGLLPSAPLQFQKISPKLHINIGGVGLPNAFDFQLVVLITFRHRRPGRCLRDFACPDLGRPQKMRVESNTRAPDSGVTIHGGQKRKGRRVLRIGRPQGLARWCGDEQVAQ
jgi:hypothetical protein